MASIKATTLSAAKWVGTIAGVVGAILVALNLGVVAHGFALFLVSSLLWCAAAVVQRELSLVILQGAFSAINVLGLWRWAGS